MKAKANPSKRKTNISKTNSSRNSIRTILREELATFEKKVDQKFVNSEINVDFKLGDLETRIDEKAKGYRDEILTSNDKLMKELEEQREEKEIGDSQIRKRLSILESA